MDSVPALSHVRHWCRSPASTTHLVRPCSQGLRSLLLESCESLLCSSSMLTGTLAPFLFSGRRTSATRMSPAVVTASLVQVQCVKICGHLAPYPPGCSRQFLAPRPREPDSQRPSCCLPQALSLQGPYVHKGFLSRSSRRDSFRRSLLLTHPDSPVGACFP